MKAGWCLRRGDRDAASGAGVSASAGLEDGGYTEAVLLQTTTLEEAARQIDSRIPPAQLKLLLQLTTRDPSLLLSLGMTRQVRMRVCRRFARSRKDIGNSGSNLANSAWEIQHQWPAA